LACFENSRVYRTIPTISMCERGENLIQKDHSMHLLLMDLGAVYLQSLCEICIGHRIAVTA